MAGSVPSDIACSIRAFPFDAVLTSDKDVDDVVMMTVSDTNVIRRKPHQEHEWRAILAECLRK